MKLWRWIIAVVAGAVVSGVALQLSDEFVPWARLAGLFRTVNPVEAELRKHLAELTGRANTTVASAADLAAATTFYNGHGGRLLWVTEDGLSERGSAVLGEIQKADDWGLRASDFALPRLSAGSLSPQAAAAAEMALTFAVLQYARDARGGRFGDPARISKVVDYKPTLPRSADVLAAIAASDAPDAYLRSLHPQHAQFEALRQTLLKLRDSNARASVEPGQTREGGETAIRMARILVNMERWRWLPTDLGVFHVWNNVPEFRTRVVRNGQTIHTDRIVAGQPEWATPAFTADMKTIVFHPSWGVPDGIRRKELWPRLRGSSQGASLLGFLTGTPSSREVLQQLKLQVYHRGRQIDPGQVDWDNANIGAYEFRQPPGPTNPLGAIKFMFPNRHDVYMHDTPERDAFAYSFRGLSHGCMRVADPLRLAAVLLAQDKGWSEQQVADLLKGGTRSVQLTTRIPVYMTYFTAVIDEQGKLQTFGDLYGLDTRMGAVLFGGKGPFVTPSYEEEIRAARNGSTASSDAPTLAGTLASIFSP